MLLAPVFLLVGLAVKADSPGPVFHRGLRTGRYGKPFRIYKFRTMGISAVDQGGLTTAYNDPRLTKFGGFLRGHKLDEFPQLINVLKGEMSIVGPRPEMPEYTGLYSAKEQAILTVRPGITDLASLEYSHLASVVGSEDADKHYMEKVWLRKNQLRMQYVREHTFLGDLKIIGRTMLGMVKK